jgi:hypothetical protein
MGTIAFVILSPPNEDLPLMLSFPAGSSFSFYYPFLGLPGQPWQATNIPRGEYERHGSISVMAGLDPAIDVFVSAKEVKTWITGTSPVMTSESRHSHHRFDRSDPAFPAQWFYGSFVLPGDRAFCHHPQRNAFALSPA